MQSRLPVALMATGLATATMVAFSTGPAMADVTGTADHTTAAAAHSHQHTALQPVTVGQVLLLKALRGQLRDECKPEALVELSKAASKVDKTKKPLTLDQAKKQCDELAKGPVGKIKLIEDKDALSGLVKTLSSKEGSALLSGGKSGLSLDVVTNLLGLVLRLLSLDSLTGALGKLDPKVVTGLLSGLGETAEEGKEAEVLAGALKGLGAEGLTSKLGGLDLNLLTGLLSGLLPLVTGGLLGNLVSGGSLPLVGGLLGSGDEGGGAGPLALVTDLLKLDAVLGGEGGNLLTGLPVLGPILGPVVGPLLSIGGTEGGGSLLSGLPLVGGVLGGVTGGKGGGLLAGLPLVGNLVTVLPLGSLPLVGGVVGGSGGGE